MTMFYDQDDDIMEVTFSDSSGQIRYVESSTGDILNYSVDSNEIVGVTILFYQHRMLKHGKIEIPEIGVAGFSAAMANLVGGSNWHGEQTH